MTLIAPTIEEALALYMGVPSLITNDGDASVYVRALGTSIQRDDPLANTFTIEYPQVEITTLPSGKQLIQPISPIRGLKSEDLAVQTVTIGGQEWPVALGMAIIAQKYVDEATVANQPSPNTI
jgi:hypothetical protein